jgi:ABC-type sugar transport system ATPase subunit
MSTPEPGGTEPAVAVPDSSEAAADPNDVLRVEHVSKRFGAVTALIDVNMRLQQGEVLALLGDNGAGKSTLLKILCGFQPPDSGRIILNGQEVTLKSVDAARALGIDVVYQDLALIDQLTVYHNMFLKRETVRWPLLNNRAMRKLARQRLDDMGIGLKSVDSEVARLSGGQRQAIAIARAIYSDAKVLLLDEPLAAMGAKEAALILDLIRNIKRKGDVSVIVIAHNYAQVLEIADRVNLLQQGEITFDKPAQDTSVQELNDIVIAEYRRALEERQRSA